jgi:alpha-beta hydrolase superfamily lysophospholipase
MTVAARGLPAFAWLLVLAALAAVAPGANARDVARPTKHSLVVDGHTLALWERSPPSPRAALLLVHGRTWSSLPNFDLRVGDRSVLDAFARAGYAAYALDLRGYGGSPRDATGWITPSRATRDVLAALDQIAARHPRLASRPALIGYSRGAQVAALVAQTRPDAMSAIVLYAFPPGVKRTTPAGLDAPPRAATTAAAAAEDFITPGAASREIIDAYVASAITADPVRADWREEDEFVFEPTKITTPTLLVYGVNDPFRNPAAEAFFGALATPDRALVVLPDSDHAAHVENSARAWVHAIDGFLSSPRAKE